MTGLSDDFEQFYVIRLEGELPARYRQLQAGHGVYLTGNKRPGSLHKAARFANIDAAETFLADWPNTRGYISHIQLCTMEKTTRAEQASEVTQRLMQIPYPYRRTAYNWMRGVDVMRLLESDQPGVLERHHKTLLKYGIDITQPSPVRLLPRRKKAIKLVQYDDKEGPRAYFSPRSQRPSGNS